VEHTEQTFPLLFLYRKEVVDSGGAGRNRGGLSAESCFIPHHTDVITQDTLSSGNAMPTSPGMMGGYPGSVNVYKFKRATDVFERLANREIPTDIAQVKGEDVTLQLRQENLRSQSFNLVGFQNHLKFGEQARVMRMIPGLENARFLRYGQIHRNTYINGPTLLRETLQMKAHPKVFFAGQICGVEGYVESIATGLLAGMHAAALATGAEIAPAPRVSAFGSLTHYVTHADAKNFQPANITFDLLPGLEQRIRDRKERHRLQCEKALREFDGWMAKVGQALV